MAGAFASDVDYAMLVKPYGEDTNRTGPEWKYSPGVCAGGMLMDADGNLYLTEIEHRAVGVIPAADRCYRRVATSPDMLWPDGLAMGPDGMNYVTVTQLPLAAPFDDGDMKARAPFRVMRFKPAPVAPHPQSCG